MTARTVRRKYISLNPEQVALLYEHARLRIEADPRDGLARSIFVRLNDLWLEYEYEGIDMVAIHKGIS